MVTKQEQELKRLEKVCKDAEKAYIKAGEKVRKAHEAKMEAWETYYKTRNKKNAHIAEKAYIKECEMALIHAKAMAKSEMAQEKLNAKKGIEWF